MVQTDFAYKYGEDLALTIPFQQEDGSYECKSVSIDEFPYYLKTGDFTDFIRLAIVQQEFRSAFKWDVLKAFVSPWYDKDLAPLSDEELRSVQKLFAHHVMTSR